MLKKENSLCLPETNNILINNWLFFYTVNNIILIIAKINVHFFGKYENNKHITNYKTPNNQTNKDDKTCPYQAN